MPVEWLVSNICEAFGCTPEEALSQDAHLAQDIMAMRTYAYAFDRESRGDKLPGDLFKAMIQMEREAGISDQ